MKMLLYIVLLAAVATGLLAYISSRQADPSERAKEAAGAAAGGALYIIAWMVQMTVKALPFLIGFVLLGVALHSCN